MTIQFCGAAREVTGSCFLLHTKGKKILVDCGMFQGSNYAADKNDDPFLFDPTTIDAVIITHAHIDHNGRVPKLVHEGYRGPIYSTDVTAHLLPIMWEDAVRIMGYDHQKTQRPQLYTEVDVKRALKKIKGIKYGKKVSLTREISFTFHDAGHILGAAWVEVISGDKSVVFSGDLGNVDVPIIREKEPYPGSDVLVMESTYGDRTHDSGTNRPELLKKVVQEAYERGGALMIPAFSLERTQEILYELNYLIDECKCIPKVPIFLDSPMAIRATHIYGISDHVFDKEAKEKVMKGDDLFDFPGLKKTLSKDESKNINDVPNPKIIIAGSGMMNGGRITHHLVRYLKDPKSTLLIVSYQADGTLGRRIESGAKSVTIWGKRVPVRCKIEHIGSYSAHADQDMLMDWVKGAKKKPKLVCLVHGDPGPAEVLADRIRGETGCQVRLPGMGDEIEI